MARKPRNPSDRFWAKVVKTTNCWEWSAGIFSNGYGQFFDGKNKIGAHRFSYALHFGQIESELKVCHKCDNRKCVNPNHLFLGTQKDNIQDMITKNRKVSADTSGTLNGRSIVNEKQVLEMRQLYNVGSPISQIARRFGTSETQTARIVKRQSWKNI